MQRYKNFFAGFMLVVSVAYFTACSGLGINLFSDKDDVNLGEQVHQEIMKDPQEYPIFTGDPSIKQYIKDRIFDHVLAAEKIEKRGIYNYQLEIIDKRDVLNAFAIPGGRVYLYTGLLKYLDSEAALAGVIGHEIAHAERRHATQRMTTQYGASMLLSLVLGQNPGEIAEIAANLFVGLSLLSNSRANEDESDQYSIEYLKSTRYYPGGVKFFFEKMQAEGLVGSGSPGLETFLSTHPDPVQRITITNQRLQQMGFPVYSYTSDGDGIYRAEYKRNILDKLK